MEKVFQLKTSNEQLSSSNKGLSNLQYHEIKSLQETSGGKISSGPIIFRWNYSSSKWYLLNKSYIKMKVKLKVKEKGAQNQIGLSMNACHNIFKNMSFRIADQTVDEISQNYPHIAALQQRMKKPQGWLKSIGNDLNACSESLPDRIDITGNKDAVIPKSLVPVKQNLLNGLTNYDAGAHKLQGTYDIATNLLTLTYTDTALNKVNFVELKNELQEGNILRIKKGLFEYLMVVKSFTAKTIAGTLLGGDFSVDSLPEAAVTDYNISQMSLKKNSAKVNSVETFELFFMPALPIWNIDHALPAGSSKVELHMNTWAKGTWEKQIVQSALATDDDDFTVDIEDMSLYLLTMDSNPIADNFQYFIDLDCIGAQTSTMVNQSESKTFDVKESSNGLTLCFTDTSFQSKTDVSPALFKAGLGQNTQDKLQRYYLNFGSETKPQPQFSGLFNDKEDTLRHIYMRTMLNSNQIYHETPETLEEFRERGLYIYVPFPRSASDRSNRVYVNYSVDPAAKLQATDSILLFHHYKKVVVCDIERQKYTRLTVIDA